MPSDNLAAYGQIISEPDLQQLILGGLSSEYNPIYTKLTTMVNEIPMEDFQAHLNAFQKRLDQQRAHTTTSSFSTNVANRSRERSFSQPHSQPSYSHPSNGRGRNHRGRGGRNSFHHTFATTGRSYAPRGPCQICGLNNHTTATC